MDVEELCLQRAGSEFHEDFRLALCCSTANCSTVYCSSVFFNVCYGVVWSYGCGNWGGGLTTRDFFSDGVNRVL